MTTYCRVGPGSDIHLWRGTGVWCARFGAALSTDIGGPCVSTESLDLYRDLVAALVRSGFRVPRKAIEMLYEELRSRDAAIAADRARQDDLFAKRGTL